MNFPDKFHYESDAEYLRAVIDHLRAVAQNMIDWHEARGLKPEECEPLAAMKAAIEQSK